MNQRASFYTSVIDEFISDRNSSVLVCGGGALDADTFRNLGFHDVTISNLDDRMTGAEYAPFKWAFENAEQLSFDDGSFDYVVIHDAVHHAQSPHRVLTEMYRVSRKGLVVVESRDSALLIVAEKLRLISNYEQLAVFYSDCKYGGVNNSEIPNYVYRWTEREIEKTIRAYAPQFEHTFMYRYGTAFPSLQSRERGAQVKSILVNLLRPLFFLITRVCPRQQNLFAFHVRKPHPQTSLYPWLTFNAERNVIAFNKRWADKRYRHHV